MGSWEKHTKGIGLKLLQKFGFKGRLGANEDGISAAVEVVVRPTNAGLGFGDTVEAANLPTNKRIVAEWKGLDPNLVDTAVSDIEKLTQEKRWKKDAFQQGASHQKAFSVDDFIEKQKVGGTGSTTNQIIMDMRHTDSGVLVNASDISASGPAHPVRPELGGELLYNVNLIASLQEQEVLRVSRLAVTEAQRLESILSELRHIEESRAGERLRAERLETLVALVGGLDSDPHLAAQCARVQRIHGQFPQEFVIFGLVDLLPGLLARAVPPSAVSDWRPLSDSSLLDSLQLACDPLVRYFLDADQSSLAQRVSVCLSDCVESLLLPAVRRAVTALDRGVDSVALVGLLDRVQLAVSQSVYQQTVDLVLLPKLSQLVANTRLGPRSPLQSWLLPWRQALGAGLFDEVLVPAARNALSSALSSRSWTVLDAWPAEEVRALRSVLGEAASEKMALQHVMPHLVRAVRQVVVNPQAQEVDVLVAVLAWTDLLPRLHVECLLLGELFPRWLRVLQAWLAMPSGVLSEVVQWYRGWKALIPGQLLAEEPRGTAAPLLLPFNVALDMIEASLAARLGSVPSDTDSFSGVLQQLDAGSFERLLEARSLEARIRAKLDSLRGGALDGNATQLPRQQHGTGVSFREVVETFAERHGVAFVPRHGKFADGGKQVFSFGESLVYIDQRVVFVADRSSSGGWAPISLDDLLRRAVVHTS